MFFYFLIVSCSISRFAPALSFACFLVTSTASPVYISLFLFFFLIFVHRSSLDDVVRFLAPPWFLHSVFASLCSLAFKLFFGALALACAPRLCGESCITFFSFFSSFLLRAVCVWGWWGRRDGNCPTRVVISHQRKVPRLVDLRHFAVAGMRPTATDPGATCRVDPESIR